MYCWLLGLLVPFVELKRKVQGLCLDRIASTLESIESRLKLQEVEYTAEDEAWMTPSSVFKQAEDISSLWRKIMLLDAHFMKYDTALRQQVCLAVIGLPLVLYHPACFGTDLTTSFLLTDPGGDPTP